MSLPIDFFRRLGRILIERGEFFTHVLPRVYALRSRGSVAIIHYHNPPRVVFEEHLEFLLHNFNVIELGTLIKAIREREFNTLPPNSLVITLDDGHRSNYELLAPARRFGCRPTIFLATGPVLSGEPFWWTRVDDKRMLAKLKTMTNDERLGLLKLVGQASVRTSCKWRYALSTEQIMEMSEVFHFQAHTRNHPILPMCSEADCLHELVSSKRDVESLLRQECDQFAYPNGVYGKRELALVRKAGFHGCRTTRPGWNDENTDPFQLRSFAIYNTDSKNILAAKLLGAQMILLFPENLSRKILGHI
jgi:peptidoglycan/xylan/chitin deacetylase (PgdA/CDA1 family)